MFSLLGKRLAFLASFVVMVLFMSSTPVTALVPDVSGFAFWVNGTTIQFMPAGTVVVPAGGLGKYQVKFPGQAAKGGIVHVTAVDGSGKWCQAQSWAESGLDEVVKVACYAPGGAPAASDFTVMFTKSTPPILQPGDHAYVDYQPGAGIVSEFNSAPGNPSVIVDPAADGSWRVVIPGLGPSKEIGNLQATAVNEHEGARCKIADWVGEPQAQVAFVSCFDAFAKPLNTRWTLSFHNQRMVTGERSFTPRFAYLWYAPPLVPGETNFNSMAGANANTIFVMPQGIYLLELPKVGGSPAHVEVTAFGPGPEYCGLIGGWSNGSGTVIVRDVVCFDAAGKGIDTGFFATYAGTH